MVPLTEKEKNGREIWGGENNKFCFGCIKFEMHTSYKVSVLRRQLDVQVWNSHKRERRAGDKNLGVLSYIDDIKVLGLDHIGRKSIEKKWKSMLGHFSTSRSGRGRRLSTVQEETDNEVREKEGDWYHGNQKR